MREIRKFNSCDGHEFATQQEAARHECEVAIPKILRDRLIKIYAADHGAPGASEMGTINKVCETLLSNRRHARIIRDVLGQYSNAVIFMPLEAEYA